MQFFSVMGRFLRDKVVVAILKCLVLLALECYAIQLAFLSQGWTSITDGHLLFAVLLIATPIYLCVALVCNIDLGEQLTRSSERIAKLEEECVRLRHQQMPAEGSEPELYIPPVHWSDKIH